jgi:hypothetical protein
VFRPNWSALQFSSELYNQAYIYTQSGMRPEQSDYIFLTAGLFSHNHRNIFFISSYLPTLQTISSFLPLSNFKTL